MCEPTLIGAGLALAGTAYQAREQRQAQKRQDAAIQQAQVEQEELTKKKQARVFDAAQQNSTQNVEQQMADAEAANRARLEAVAQDANQTIGASASASAAGGSPGGSDTYRVENANRAASELTRAIGEAGMLAKAGAPQKMLFDRSLSDANTASEVDDISSLMRQAANRQSLNIERAGRVSPGRMMLGNLMQIGGAYVGSRGSGGGNPNSAAGSTRATFWGDR